MKKFREQFVDKFLTESQNELLKKSLLEEFLEESHEKKLKVSQQNSRKNPSWDF